MRVILNSSCNNLLLFYVLIFFSNKTFSQSNYTQIPESNAVWKIVYYCPQPAPFSFCEWISDSIAGDTTISGLLFHKILRTTYDAFCNDVVILQPTYHGSFRQDTVNKKVYYLEPSGQENLLYDFDLAIGDTVNTYNTCSLRRVVEIDSLLINGTFRKRYKLEELLIQCGDPYYIIEGVGCNNGFTEQMTNLNSFLACFKNGNNVEYMDSATIDCHSPYDTCFTSYTSSLNNSFKYPYPNPTANNIQIDNELLPTKYILQSLTGKILCEGYLVENPIKIPPLENGLYFLILNKNKLKIVYRISISLN